MIPPTPHCLVYGDPAPVWWTAGLDTGRRPLAVFVGAPPCPAGRLVPTLARVAGRGYAVVAAGLPGLAPGTRPYAADSWRLLPELIDHYAAVTRTAQVHAVGFGLGGHLALRAAAADGRIATVHAVGAPVSRLFTDLACLLGLPVGATDELVLATGAGGRATLPERLDGLAVTPEELRAVRAAVRIGVVAADPFVPPQDLALLRLLLDRATFRVLPGAGSRPAGRSLRRWLAAGLRRARALPR